jgi:hypothetical protein
VRGIDHAKGGRVKLETEMEMNHFYVTDPQGHAGNHWFDIRNSVMTRQRIELRDSGPARTLLGNCVINGNTAETTFSLSATDAKTVRIGGEFTCELVKVSASEDRSHADTKQFTVKVGVSSNGKDALIPAVQRIRKITVRETLTISEYGIAKLRTEFPGVESGWKLLIKKIPQKGGRVKWTEQDTGFPSYRR